MRPEQLRAILQATFLVGIIPVLFFFGVGCLCYAPPPSGNDSGSSPEMLVQTYEIQQAPGEVSRNHFIPSAVLKTSAGESDTINQALPGSFLGILLPTAPGASQPGQLLDGANVMGPVATPIALKPDRTQIAVLDALFPPPSGSQWVAMVMSDTHALDQFFSGPVDTSNLSLYLSYGIDFRGTDPCNGCAIKLAGCVPGQFSPFLPVGVATAHSSAVMPGEDVVCTQPVTTYITLVDPFNNFQPLPGAPVVAAFGLYGGQPTTPTVNGLLELPINLEHTAPTTRTFDLASIQSVRGWTYQWADLQGAPISQIAIPGPFQPYYIQPTEPDMKLMASGVPTCTQAIDVVTLQATDTVTQSLQAEAQAYVQVLPDPANCPIADVATIHSQQTAAVVGGDRITYTLTISNLMGTAISGIIEQTISPASAVRGADLPAGCAIAANVVTCQVADIAAQGAKSVTVEILGAGGYSGELRSLVEVYPANAADAAYLDNTHGPLVATVSFASPTSLPEEDEPAMNWQLYVPHIQR